MKPKKNKFHSVKKPCVKTKNSLPFAVGDEVLARWQDGLFYLAVIKTIDEENSKCHVTFEDGSEYRISFKNIRTSPQEGDISCIICGKKESKIHNEIIVCDRCNHGYHQTCHTPVLDDQHIEQPELWFCRVCIFSTAAKAGGALKTGPEADAMKSMKQVLPYDMSSLKWDSNHKTNTSETYCYCGGPGVWYYKMLECYTCRQWFHEACLQCLDFPLLLGDRYFYFLCALCNDGKEYLKRIPLRWSNIATLVLYNLSLKYDKRGFSSIEIKRFLKNYWNELRTGELHDTPLEDRIENVLSILNAKKRKKFRCYTGHGIVFWSLIVRTAPSPTKCSLLREHHLNMQSDAACRYADCNGNYLLDAIQSDKKYFQSDDRPSYTRVHSRPGAVGDIPDEVTSPQFPLFPSPSMFKYFFPSSARGDLENGNATSSVFTSDQPGARQGSSEDHPSPGEKRGQAYDNDTDSDRSTRRKFFAYAGQLGDDITYEGSLGRLVCGEACTIHGRRLSKDGRTEYLVEWTGTTPNN